MCQGSVDTGLDLDQDFTFIPFISAWDQLFWGPAWTLLVG